MQTKLKIKMGHIEFEYEGDTVYDNEAVKDLFSHIESLASAAPPDAFDIRPPLDNSESEDRGESAVADVANFSVQTIAAQLGDKSAKGITLAAAVHLQLCQGHKSFTRKDLLSMMQKAHGYYNQTMSRNISATLQRLVAAKSIMAMTGDQMALSASELTRLKAKLAQP